MKPDPDREGGRGGSGCTAVGGSLTGGVGRQALRMASELECSEGYLCSGREGCMAKWGCLLFMDIILEAFGWTTD